MFKIVVPATSANCCVGFDSLGMALELYATFTFDRSDQLIISGCDIVFQNSKNLVVQAFYHVCDVYQKEYPNFYLSIDSPIPVSRGLGSSAACVVAGVMAANIWFSLNLNKMELLKLACDIEGHPDNVAPAIFGKACVTFFDHDRPYLASVDTGHFQAVVLIPETKISTQEARKGLPTTLSISDVCAQLARAMAFCQALRDDNEFLLKACCKDVIHEPVRKKLILAYKPCKEVCDTLNMPMWISGSGSTLMAVSCDLMKLEVAYQQLAALNVGHVLRLSIDTKGVQVIYE